MFPHIKIVIASLPPPTPYPLKCAKKKKRREGGGEGEGGCVEVCVALFLGCEHAQSLVGCLPGETWWGPCGSYSCALCPVERNHPALICVHTVVRKNLKLFRN